jgi:hypothetical protein
MGLPCVQTIVDAIGSKLLGVLSLVRIWETTARDQNQLKTCFDLKGVYA